jgi:hypothetical protein
MNKPKIKKELAVRDYNERYRWIAVNATNDAIQEYAEFGDVHCIDREKYTLQVDARFDFEEVLAWMQSHGEEAA